MTDWEVAALQWEKVAQQATQRAEAAEAALAEERKTKGLWIQRALAAEAELTEARLTNYGQSQTIDHWKARAEAAEARAHELSIKYVCALRRAREMGEALTQAEACMSIVEPRSDKAEYLRVLGVIRDALASQQVTEP